MKKIFYTLSFLLCSCNAIFDTGAANAEEFVKSKIDASIIESIKVEPCDSILCDLPVDIAYSGMINGDVSAEEFAEIFTDVNNSLVTKGSLKYDNMKAWRRKTYTVIVETKDGTTNEVQVIMDVDGVTPRITGGEMSKKLNEYMPH